MIPSSKVSGSTFKIKAATSKTCLWVALSNACLAFRFSLNLAYVYNKIIKFK